MQGTVLLLGVLAIVAPVFSTAVFMKYPESLLSYLLLWVSGFVFLGCLVAIAYLHWGNIAKIANHFLIIGAGVVVTLIGIAILVVGLTNWQKSSPQLTAPVAAVAPEVIPPEQPPTPTVTDLLAKANARLSIANRNLAKLALVEEEEGKTWNDLSTSFSDVARFLKDPEHDREYPVMRNIRVYVENWKETINSIKRFHEEAFKEPMKLTEVSEIIALTRVAGEPPAFRGNEELQQAYRWAIRQKEHLKAAMDEMRLHFEEVREEAEQFIKSHE
jgi:hypothetical protein